MKERDMPAAGTSDTDQRSPRKALRILIVDDEALILMAAVEMLEELGHEAVPAHNAQKALSFLQAGGGFDAIITDISLPDSNGEELVQEARRLRPRLPAVFATGHRRAVPEALAKTGPTAVLGKPYWSGELDKALRSVC
jgi:CheY-like chemotaxis protein